MTHVYCLGHLLGRSGDAELAAQGLSGLLGRLRDEQSGGWFTSIDDDGGTPDEKAGYTHAFVVLAASSARTAALPGADDPAGGGPGRLAGEVLRSRRRACSSTPGTAASPGSIPTAG